jgi:hypothetical protein
MSRNPGEAASRKVEAVHTLALGTAATGLVLGLVARRPVWVNLGISLILLLPPLRLATTIFREAHARRYGIAAMGVVVLALLLFSRRIS